MSSAVNLFGVYKSESMNRFALEVLASGQIATGPYVKKFSDGFGLLTQQKNVVTVNDMSNAIQIALRLSNVEPGDEVLTTSYSCMSSNSPIAAGGACPVWVDVNPNTGSMDADALERAITPRSKAVIVYHLAGYPADILRISAICKSYGLKLIEDCNNSLLATINNRQVGTFGDFAIFSFYPNRQINASEGGALCCKNSDDAERAIRLRRYGIDSNIFRDELGEINVKCDIAEVGWAATLNNLCSSLGYAQLADATTRITTAREIAERYAREFASLDEITIVHPAANAQPSHWAYLIQVRNRDSLLSFLKQRGIHTSKLHHRTDLYSCFKKPSQDLPGTQYFLDNVLALPCGWWMNEEDLEAVITAIRDFLSQTNNTHN